jgi:hypothetical protein
MSFWARSLLSGINCAEKSASFNNQATAEFLRLPAQAGRLQLLRMTAKEPFSATA